MDKNIIGTNAGLIWQLLAERGALSIVELRKHSDIKAANIFLALGWLAREDKIEFYEEEELYVKLQPSDEC